MDNYFETIKAIDKINQNLFQLLLKFENIHFKNKPLLKNIIRGKYSVKRGKIYSNFNTESILVDELIGISDDEIKIIIEVINYFNNFSLAFDPIMNQIGEYIGLSVFFIPGTDKAIPIFFGNWTESNSSTLSCNIHQYPNYYKHHFHDDNNEEGRVDKVSEDLKHLKYELYNKIIPNQPVKLVENKQGFDHFFFWIKAIIDLQYICGYRIKDSNVLFNKENGIILEYDYKTFSEISPYCILSFNDESEPDIKIYWKSDDEWKNKDFGKQPLMLYNPIYINHDTFALVVTFFLNKGNHENIFKNSDEVKFIHKYISNSIFECIYNAILRENNQLLFENLQREFISRSLLDNCSKYLTRDSSFTYFWVDSKNSHSDSTLTCADIRSHIYGDYYKNPQDIFRVIIDIEKNIYKKLQNETQTILSPWPDNVPNKELLKNMEYTLRSLEMYDRDHIIHQFQVFLSGTNLINKNFDLFKLKFSTTIINRNQILKKQKELVTVVSDENQQLNLLKLSWFFIALFHDIGYPVEKVDNIIKELKNKVSKLPSISDEYIQELPKISFSPILYDDPRAYILLKELANYISQIDTAKYKDKKQRWWYLIRYLSFEKKRHELMSVLTLGNLFLNESHSEMESFINDPYGQFIISNILLPISLHHFGAWKEDLEKIPIPISIIKKEDLDIFKTKGIDLSKEDKKIYDEVLKKYREILNKDFLPDIKNFKINFDSNPLTVLLMFCDSWQEEGRPSGTKKSEWAESCTEHLDLTKSEFLLKFHYKLESDVAEDSCRSDLKSKIRKVKKLFETHIGVGPMSNFKVLMEGDIHYRVGKRVNMEFTTDERKELEIILKNNV